MTPLPDHQPTTPGRNVRRTRIGLGWHLAIALYFAVIAALFAGALLFGPAGLALSLLCAVPFGVVAALLAVAMSGSPRRLSAATRRTRTSAPAKTVR